MLDDGGDTTEVVVGTVTAVAAGVYVGATLGVAGRVANGVGVVVAAVVAAAVGAGVSSGAGGRGTEGPGTSLAWLAGGNDGLLDGEEPLAGVAPGSAL